MGLEKRQLRYQILTTRHRSMSKSTLSSPVFQSGRKRLYVIVHSRASERPVTLRNPHVGNMCAVGGHQGQQQRRQGQQHPLLNKTVEESRKMRG